MIAKDLPTKSANTWEVDSKGDLNEDEGKETSELGGEGGWLEVRKRIVERRRPQL